MQGNDFFQFYLGKPSVFFENLQKSREIQDVGTLLIFQVKIDLHRFKTNEQLNIEYYKTETLI